MSFGSELRQEREKRGVGLAAIAAGTKVSERYLRALEGDEYHELPGGIFNKGMVRGYCRQLGLDEQEWLQRFAVSCETGGGEPDWSAFAENVNATRLRSGAARRRWLGVAIMVVAIAALVWCAWHFILQRRIGKPKVERPTVGMVVTRKLPSDRARVNQSETLFPA